MKANKKMVIILLLILIFVLILCVLYAFKLKSKNNSNSIINQQNDINIDGADQNDIAPTLYTDTSIKKATSTQLLLVAQNCINVYYKYNYASNTTAMINLINKSYIKEKKITENNLFSHFEKVNNNINFIALDAYEKEISFDHENQYYIYGAIYDDKYKKIGESLFVVNLDLYNNTFSLIPYGNISSQTYINTINKLIADDNGGTIEAGKSKVTSIEKNEYNIYEMKKYNEITADIIQNYYKQYYYYQINDQKFAYQLLDDKYKTNRFKTENNYYTYISNNKNAELDLQNVTKYIDGNINKYIGIDKNNNYFIIIENSPLNFKIMLDSYSNPLSETINKYDSSQNEQKSCMCIETVKEMINNKDYDTIYSHLNETFKANNFKSVDEFKIYMNNKYFNYNNFTYESYTTINNNYNVKVKVIDHENEENHFNTNFIIKLGTAINDFEMSFNIE